MKHNLLRTLFMACVLPVSLIGQISQEGLIAYYPLDGDVLDYGQNNYHGTLVGGVFGEDRNGNANSALRLNGIDQYINLNILAESFRDNLSEISIYFLVKFEGNQESQTILSLGNNGETIDNNVFEIEFENNQIQVETETGTNAINHELEIDNSVSVVDQRWHEILIKINGDSLTYCRDNTLMYKGTYVPAETSTNELFIGSFDGNNSNFSCCFFDGWIDELQFYNTLDLQHNDSLNYNGCQSDNFEIEINGTVYNVNNPTGNEFIENCCVDTMVSIQLIFSDDYYIQINEQHCISSNYEIEINGVLYNETNPVGIEVLQSINLCDSILDINLEFIDNYEDSISEIFCEGDGDGILVNGTEYNQSNPVGIEIIPSSQGCDSMINIELHYHPVSYDTIRYFGCNNDPFELEINNNIYNSENSNGFEILTSSIGCDSIVLVDLEFVANDCQFYLPNIFSPESGIIANRSIYPLTSSGCDYEVRKFMIYDRWGNLIHNDTMTPWDGYINGSDMVQGVYTYAIEIESTCGIIMKSGTISVIK